MTARGLAFTIGLVASMAAVAAQEPVAPAPIHSKNDGLFPPPTPVVPTVVQPESTWMVDVVFGLPVQLRLQRKIADTQTWIEGGLAL